MDMSKQNRRRSQQVKTETKKLQAIPSCKGETFTQGCWSGRSYAESPDVDGRIFFTGKGVEAGEFVTVKITGEVDGEPVGEAVKGKSL